MKYENEKKLMTIAIGSISGFAPTDKIYFSFTSKLFPEIKEYTLLDEDPSVPFGSVMLTKEHIIRLRDFCNKVLDEI